MPRFRLPPFSCVLWLLYLTHSTIGPFRYSRGLFFNTTPDRFGHCYRTGLEVSCAGPHVICGVFLTQAFLTSLSTAWWKPVLWIAFVIDWLTIIPITAKTLRSLLDSVTHPASPRCHITLLAPTNRIHPKQLQTISTRKADEWTWTNLVLGVERSSDKGLSARPSNTTLPSAFRTPVLTFFKADSSIRGVIGAFPTYVEAFGVSAIWHPPWSMHSTVLITVTSSSRSSQLDCIIR